MQNGHDFASLINTHVGDNDESESSSEEEEKGKREKKETTDDKLIKEEGRDKGEVKWQIYQTYFNSLGGMLFVFLVLLLYTSDSASQVSTNYFLAFWSEESTAASENNQEFNNTPYLAIYIGLGLLVAGFSILKVH